MLTELADTSAMHGLLAAVSLRDLPLLSVLVFLPALGALAIALVCDEGETALARRIALGVLLAAWLPAAAVLSEFDPESKPTASYHTLENGLRDYNATGLQMHLTEHHRWLGDFGISYYLGVDGTNIWLVLLAALMGPLAVAASGGIDKRVREYLIALLLLQSAVMGVFLAQDLILFYVFFEFTLIPAYLLVGVWGGAERRYAAGKFFLFTFVGGVVTLAGIIWVALTYSHAAGRPLTFDVQELYANLHQTAAGSPDWPTAQVWLFAALLAGFAVKTPIFPLHSWLPIAYAEAPTPVTVLLSALLSKMGAYGIVKFVIPLAPHGAITLLPLVTFAAAGGVVYAALVALTQRDIKRLLAYSSISHVSWCVVGAMSLTPQGLTGSLLQMVNHGLSVGGLFLIAGFLYDRYRTRDIESYSGLWKSMPAMTFLLALFTMASVGLPGLNGFVGEFLILVGMFQVAAVRDPVSGTIPVAGWFYAAVTAGGILLGAWYMFSLLRKLVFGAERFPAGTRAPDFGLREWLILALPAALCVIIGVYPKPFLRPIENSAEGLLEAVRRGGVEVVRRSPAAPPTRGIRTGPTGPTTTGPAGH